MHSRPSHFGPRYAKLSLMKILKLLNFLISMSAIFIALELQATDLVISNPSVCKITFKQDPGEPDYSCVASYIGRGYFLTVRHCLYAPQSDPEVDSYNDYSVDPNQVLLSCPGYTEKLDVDTAIHSRKILASEERLSIGGRLTVRDLIIFRVPVLQGNLKPIQLYDSLAEMTPISPKDQAWFLSYGVSNVRKVSRSQVRIELPEIQNLSYTVLQPELGLISYKGSLIKRGDSGGPLSLKNSTGTRVIALASNYCHPDQPSCGESFDYYNFVSNELLRDRFCANADRDLRKLLKCR